MGDEPFKRLHESRANTSANSSTSPHQAAYASQRAEVLFGCYRRGDANDPARYVAAITAVLSSYDADLIYYVTDPRTGVQTSEKFATFMPNAGELKRYCDAEAARRANVERLGSLPKPNFNAPRLMAPKPGPGTKATCFVANTHPRFQQFQEWATAQPEELSRYGESAGVKGIWVAQHAVDEVYQRRGGIAARQPAKPAQQPAEAAE